MTKIILTTTLTFLFAANVNSQNKWTKDDRNNLYSDCMSNISKYNTATNEQKESVCICFIDEISKKYPKDEYQAKIDAETKRIREATLIQCSKTTGIELGEKKAEVKIENNNAELPVTKENIVGHWKDENSEFWLFETGDYKMQYNDGKSAKGTWKVDNNQLDLYKDKLFGKSEKLFKILIFTKDKFVYQSLKKKADTFTATRVQK
jgi:hypothetical protein